MEGERVRNPRRQHADHVVDVHAHDRRGPIEALEGRAVHRLEVCLEELLLVRDVSVIRVLSLIHI